MLVNEVESSWDHDRAVGPDGYEYRVEIRPLGRTREFTPGIGFGGLVSGVISFALGWTSHVLRHHGRWAVEVRRASLDAPRYAPYGIRWRSRWRSRPFATADDASDEIDRALATIRTGDWPPKDGSYVRQ